MPRRRLRHVIPVGALALSALTGAVACSDSDSDSDTDSGGVGGVELALGEQVYGEACASCHGSDLRGTDLGPSHLSIVYEPGHHSDESFRSAISNGSPAHHWSFGDMPPVGGLDDAQVDAVIAYIRDVQEREGFEPYPPE